MWSIGFDESLVHVQTGTRVRASVGVCDHLLSLKTLRSHASFSTGFKVERTKEDMKVPNERMSSPPLIVGAVSAKYGLLLAHQLMLIQEFPQFSSVPEGICSIGDASHGNKSQRICIKRHIQLLV